MVALFDNKTAGTYHRIVGVESGTTTLNVNLFDATVVPDKMYWVVVDFLIQNNSTNGDMSAQRIAAIIKGGSSPSVTSVNITARQTIGSVTGTFAIVNSSGTIVARFDNDAGADLTMQVHAEIFK